MSNRHPLALLHEKCDIFFEGSLISREFIIEKYIDFLASSFSNDNLSVSLTLNTGSICFDAVLILSAAIASIAFALKQGDAEKILDSLNCGDMVLYGLRKYERYIWCGFADENFMPTSLKSKRYYGVLKQPTKSTKDKKYVPKKYWHLITPYDGKSRLTDGRGIKLNSGYRNNFISYLFKVDETSIPSISNISTVIVANRELFERISRGLQIVYGEKSIELLQMVTASYFSDSGEEYQLGGNPSKTEPVLKITGKLSTARELILDNQSNKTAGLVIIGDKALSKGGFELRELLQIDTLKFIHIATKIDSVFAEDLLKSRNDLSVFACTKEFLLRNSLPLYEKNELTLELGKQIDNIIENVVSTMVVKIDCTWEDYRLARESLFLIKQSEWDESKKIFFLKKAFSLIKLFINAVFPLEKLEKAINKGILASQIASPALRIKALKDLAENAPNSVKKWCEYVDTFLEYLYDSLLTECPKRNLLVQHLKSNFTITKESVVVVVPKTFYLNVIKEDKELNSINVKFVSANSFDNTEFYDEIVVVGDIASKQFNPLKCKASSSNTTVLLYQFEENFFKHKMHRAVSFEKELNSKLGVLDGFCSDVDLDIALEEDDFIQDSENLEQFIDKMNPLIVKDYLTSKVAIPSSAKSAEVAAVGKFTNGEQILFSKFYRAVVFDSDKGSVYEVDVDGLEAGNELIIFKRDDYTRNIVDHIFVHLLESGAVSNVILEAAEKAQYWKKALKEYKINHELSYRDIAEMLHNLGSDITEVTVRQWLIEESHIIGPRNEETLVKIAKLTQNPMLLANTHDYYEACRLIRRFRTRILDFIGKAIIDQLNGKKTNKDGVWEIVYDNVENLAEILELDSIFLLDEPIALPVNLINKPIADWEAIF